MHTCLERHLLLQQKCCSRTKYKVCNTKKSAVKTLEIPDQILLSLFKLLSHTVLLKMAARLTNTLFMVLSQWRYQTTPGKC